MQFCFYLYRLDLINCDIFQKTGNYFYSTTSFFLKCTFFEIKIPKQYIFDSQDVGVFPLIVFDWNKTFFISFTFFNGNQNLFFNSIKFIVSFGSFPAKKDIFPYKFMAKFVSVK